MLQAVLQGLDMLALFREWNDMNLMMVHTELYVGERKKENSFVCFKVYTLELEDIFISVPQLGKLCLQCLAGKVPEPCMAF